MTNLTTTPLENQYESQIVGEISAGATAPFDIEVKTAPQFTLSGGDTFYAILEPGTSKEEGVEITATSGTTLTIGTRGLPTYKGGSATTTSHGGGSTIIISDNWQIFDDIETAIESKADLDSPEFETYIRVPVYADDTARDAAITSPENGMLIYNTADGVNQQYVGGAWLDVDTGSTPNASDTVAGKVELATQAELDDGTDVGGTGASLVAIPSVIAEAVQDQSFSFAADGEASDAYAITLTPAPDAYATGQRFTFTANTANTGAATLNVNTLGAKTIKKHHDQDLETGDIESGQVVEVVYDGTNFQMVSASAIAPASLKVQTVVQGTRAINAANASVDYAHGLGETPRYIKIKAKMSSGSTASNFLPHFCDGWSDGSDNYCNYTTATSNASGTISYGSGNNASYCVYLNQPTYSGGSQATVQRATATFDSTNVTLDWTLVGSGTGTGTIFFQIEVYT